MGDALAQFLGHVEGAKHLSDADLTALLARYGLLDDEDRVVEALSERGWIHCLNENSGDWWSGGTGEILVMVVRPFRKGRRVLARAGEVGSVFEEPEGDKLVGLHRQGKSRRRLLPGSYLEVLGRH